MASGSPWRRLVRARPTARLTARLTAQLSSQLTQVLTLPNLVSLVRLAGVAVFVWLLLGPHADGWAVVVLSVGAATDWVDGFLARRLGQVSRLGELLDPFVDRLYILAALLALTARGVLAWPFAVALLAREAMLAGCLPVLRRYGYGPPPVHFVGKSSTFALLAAFPTLLLAHSNAGAAAWAHPLGWALAWWGLVFYWVAGLFYLAQVVGVVRQARRAEWRYGDRRPDTMEIEHHGDQDTMEMT